MLDAAAPDLSAQLPVPSWVCFAYPSEGLEDTRWLHENVSQLLTTIFRKFETLSIVLLPFVGRICPHSSCRPNESREFHFGSFSSCRISLLAVLTQRILLLQARARERHCVASKHDVPTAC